MTTLLRAKRADHSTKPADVYAMAEDIGEPPRLEMFARERRQGWDAWGLEVPATVQGVLSQ